MELLTQRVEELSQVICTEWFANDEMRRDISDLQERVNSSSLRSGTSFLQPTSDPPNYYPDEEGDKIRVSQGGIKAREREIVREVIDKKS